MRSDRSPTRLPKSLIPNQKSTMRYTNVERHYSNESHCPLRGQRNWNTKNITNDIHRNTLPNGISQIREIYIFKITPFVISVNNRSLGPDKLFVAAIFNLCNLRWELCSLNHPGCCKNFWHLSFGSVVWSRTVRSFIIINENSILVIPPWDFLLQRTRALTFTS